MINKQQCWHPSRAAALAQLEHFVANAGSKYTSTGQTAELLVAIKLALKKQDIQLLSSVRHWDETVWPHSSKGSFALKKKIPQLLDALYPTETSVIQQSLPF